MLHIYLINDHTLKSARASTAAYRSEIECRQIEQSESHNLSGREKVSASHDFTVCIIRCVYRAELILGR